jgi:hypothetical protein
MVGYATAYTMLPVFSLVLDRDVNEDVALLYPELYRELTKVSTPSDGSCAGLTVCLPGTLAFVQDVLHLAHDQCLPRSVPFSIS